MKEKLDSLCDLHIHSNFSDSDMDLESIFTQASAKKLRCIAITDHDTVDAIGPARLYSKTHNIELIEGIELSAQHEEVEIHILGYFIDSENKKLRDELANIKELRRERLLDMATVLNSLGVKVEKDELLSKIVTNMPTRLHLGLYLVEKGITKSLREAFKKYLSPGKPAYKARFKYSVKEAAELIKLCGGLSFLAHPHMIPNQSWVEKFISFGVDGLELVYPNMSQQKHNFYQEMILKHKLLRSGGSDAHGSYKEFTQIGSVTIPYAWVLDMRERIAKR
jgi:predicted metal-dependent phosphoesterase TrpH